MHRSCRGNRSNNNERSIQQGHFSRSPVRTMHTEHPTVVPADAHGGETSIRWSVPGPKDHVLVMESRHYRLGLLGDLAMWFCLSELLSPKPSGHLASAAKARSNNTAIYCNTLQQSTHCNSLLTGTTSLCPPMNSGSTNQINTSQSQNNNFLMTNSPPLLFTGGYFYAWVAALVRMSQAHIWMSQRTHINEP